MARTRANDYDDKRGAILRASARVFGEHGVDRASMAQIAAGCGVSKALLYHYYQSKEELVFDIVRTHLEELDAALVEADEPKADPRTRLRGLVGAMLDVYRDSDDEHRVQLGAMRLLPPDRQQAILALERDVVRRFSGVLRLANPALAQGPLLAPVTMSLFGMLNWVYLWFRPDGPITREQYADLATRLILDGASSIGAEEMAALMERRAS
ncbi:TetR/AcrR family transcriptional regulator [Salinarimonas sp.]|uniref:TetR/AcrR family transcriptional regulator n=1 Tax=Salinarimonas sp. TaxID=2766526 RepID=UPI0032D99E23